MRSQPTGSKSVMIVLAAFCIVLFCSSGVFASTFDLSVQASISGPLTGVKAYAFTEAGSYTGLNATTDSNGSAQFTKEDFADGTYRFRVDYFSEQYWSDAIAFPENDTATVTINQGNVTITVSDSSADLPGINIYLYNSVGTYLNLSAGTDGAGQAAFVLPLDLSVKCRADYLGYQFWSETAVVTPGLQISVPIPSQQIDITVQGSYQGQAQPFEGINTYLFKPPSSFLGIVRVTDSAGNVTLNLPDQTYRVRVDYLGGQFWSNDFSASDTTIDIPLADAEISVTGNGAALPGVNVFAFSAAGAYLGLSQTTDASGRAVFRLPAGDYQFRADYQDGQYFSSTEILQSDVVNPVAISTGGGTFVLKVQKDTGQALANISCYVFTDAGTYLGLTSATDPAGNVSFNLADGNYKLRIDYLGYQYWTGVYTVPTMLSDTYSIAHRDAVTTVNSAYQGGLSPLESIPVYLFTAGGVYLDITTTTDAAGQAMINLPVNTFKMRADYLEQQYWSAEFSDQDVQIDIPAGVAQVHVTGSGQDLGNVPVYVFTAAGAYLGITANTDAAGQVEFILPVGDYKFRADYQASQYWAEAAVVADTVNAVALNTGGGVFALSVDDGSASLANAETYVFSSGGTYLGITGATDASGNITFALSDGIYRFRIDLLGYQFWSADYTLPDTLAGTFSIPHQDIAVTVQRDYPTAAALESIPTYFFTAAGTYLGLSATTNPSGQVVYRLPDKEYKVRADYRGAQFWTDVFQSQDTTLNIAHGIAEVHVTTTGIDLAGVPVYLFSATDAYLGWNEVTDATGRASFLLPAGSYKFRVDENDQQHWSSLVTVVAGQTNPVLIALGIQLPSKPVITGGTVASGTIQPRPVQNTADQFVVELTGTRDPGTSVWINGLQRVTLGDVPWSVQLTLDPGSNAFEVWLVDLADNQGESEWIDIRIVSAEVIRFEYNDAGRMNRVTHID